VADSPSPKRAAAKPSSNNGGTPDAVYLHHEKLLMDTLQWDYREREFEKRAYIQTFATTLSIMMVGSAAGFTALANSKVPEAVLVSLSYSYPSSSCTPSSCSGGTAS